jgi:hypothetical protein
MDFFIIGVLKKGRNIQLNNYQNKYSKKILIKNLSLKLKKIAYKTVYSCLVEETFLLSLNGSIS